MRSRRIFILETISWLAVSIVIIVLSLASSRTVNSVMVVNDKLTHLSAYAVLGFFSYTVVRRLQLPWSSTEYLRQLISALIALVYCLVIGGVLELLQQYTGRTPEIMDFVADAGGAFIGISLAWIAIRISQFIMTNSSGNDGAQSDD